MPKRDLVSWNTIISVYAQNGLARMSLEFVVQMHEEGARRPDSITIVSILPAVVNIGSLRIGKAVHGNVVPWNLIIAGYVEGGNPEEAVIFFSEDVG
ncbi:hypothetical protein Q3G72_015114 [Acer saccharum]|nr:hypothetical protein Q3G72_015114 [Acer saccharum]